MVKDGGDIVVSVEEALAMLLRPTHDGFEMEECFPFAHWPSIC